MEVGALAEEEMMREIISMIKTGGLEAVVLVDVEEEVEALWVEGIGVLQPGKAVLKEGPRLSNGTGKRNRLILEISMITIIITATIMMRNGMVIIIMISTTILSSNSSSTVDAKSSLSYFTQLTLWTCIQVGCCCARTNV